MSWEEVCQRLEVNPGQVYQAMVKDLKQLGWGEHFHLTGLPGGASNRGYLRLKCNSLSKPGPASMIVMVLKDTNPMQGIEEVVADGFKITELPFLSVLKHFQKSGVAVPELYHYDADPGLIFIEDLGDVLLRDAIMEADMSARFKLFELAVDELARIHLTAGSLRDPRFIGFRVKFGSKLLRWELEHFREWALDKRLGPVLKNGESRLLEQCFDLIVSELLAAPYILSHRDYHIDNLMMTGGRVRVIDFQDAFMAPYAYDLACLLYDRDTSLILGNGLIEHVITYYFQRLSEQGFQPLDAAGYRRVFDLCVLHRAFKVVGRFYFLDLVKHKPEYLNFMPAEYTVLRGYLNRFPEFQPVKDMLKQYLPELK